MARLRTSEIFSDSNLTLVAVESIDFWHSRTNTNCQLYGNIEPIAVIVYSSDGTYALDMDAKPVNFEQLRQTIPELNATVSPLNEA